MLSRKEVIEFISELNDIADDIVSDKNESACNRIDVISDSLKSKLTEK